MLNVIAVSKALGPTRVLDDVSFRVHPGEVAVVEGANGAGKSTLLRIVSGILTADRGRVLIADAELGKDDVRAKSNLGYVPDSTDVLPNLSVGEFLGLIVALRRPSAGAREPRTDEWVERFGLASLGGHRLASLSLGQRKRVHLVAALCADPALLVLDEPSNGLDPDGARLVVDIIFERKPRGQTTLLCTNDTAFARAIDGTEYLLRGGALTPKNTSIDRGTNESPSSA